MRRAAAIVISLLFPLGAQAEDGTVDLDHADVGRTRTLNSVDVGETDDLDDADRGQTRSLDSYDGSGETRSLDSVDNGREEDLDEADTGRTVDLGVAENNRPQPVAAPAPVPEGASAERRAEAERIREQAVVAARRLDGANAAYSQMMSRGYPAGDERLKIIQERDAARKAWEEANARYSAVLQQMGH
jgi:hypothetical protein